MTRQAIKEMTAEERVAFEEFNNSVNNCIQGMFAASRDLMGQGATAAAVALSNALTAADIAAAIAIDNDRGEEMIEVMLNDLLSDMKVRAAESFKRYGELKAKELATSGETVDA